MCVCRIKEITTGSPGDKTKTVSLTEEELLGDNHDGVSALNALKPK